MDNSDLIEVLLSQEYSLRILLEKIEQILQPDHTIYLYLAEEFLSHIPHPVDTPDDVFLVR
jgi:hypothetical protein